MSKPTVFFSHSSRDKQTLTLLKDMVVEKTGGSIDIFLSSDGQSIPLGHNWVHRIQEALAEAKLMLVFISPNALRSNWIFFESGFAYAKKISLVNEITTQIGRDSLNCSLSEAKVRIADLLQEQGISPLLDKERIYAGGISLFFSAPTLEIKIAPQLTAVTLPYCR